MHARRAADRRTDTIVGARMATGRISWRGRMEAIVGSHACTALIACLGALALSAKAAADVRYVDASIAVGGNGQSWATAYKTLQAALTAANANPAITEIWVADGTYKPTLRLDAADLRSVTFKLKNGLTLYGGFAGGETSLAQRNPAVNIATLSGDIGVVGVNTDNAYHVVYSSLNAASAVIDGFTIRDGYAENASNGGGGLYLTDSSATIRNCRFTANFAITDGGAIRVQPGGGPSFIDCVVDANSAGNGAAVVNSGNGALFDGCTFSNNTVRGAVELASGGSATFIDCNFLNNAHSWGGTFSALRSIAPKVTILQCTFSGNTLARAVELNGELTLTDSLFIGNTHGAVSAGNLTQPSIISDCVFESNGSIATVSIGGALVGGNTEVRRCRFEGNQANLGGAVSGFFNGFVDCDFLNNSAGTGGAVRVAFGPFVNCRFAGNTAANGGAIHFSSSDPGSFIQCLFTGNSATSIGGAVTVVGSNALLFEGCTFVGNSGPFSGGIAIDTSSSPVTIENSILWGNTSTTGSTEAQQVRNLTPSGVTILSSTVQGWSGALGGTGNDGLDPVLSLIAGDDGLIGTLDDNPTPGVGSSAIESGNPALLSADTFDLDGDGLFAEPLSRDLVGNDRVLGTALDRGPVERDPNGGDGVYIGPPGGSWFVASHWSGNAVPSPSTAVVIDGSVVIDAPGATAATIAITASGTLTIDAPNAALTVGTITSDGGLDLHAGSLTIADELTSASTIEVGCADAFTITLDGALLTAPTLLLCPGGMLTGYGEVDAAVTNGGTIDPDGGDRTLRISGDFTQTATGSLLLDLADGLFGTPNDLLLLDGASASLDGSVTIGLDATVAEPSVHTVLNGPLATVGTFDTVTLPPAVGEFTFGFELVAGDLSVTSVSSAPAGSTRFVRPAASPLGTGTSWGNAYSSLDAAIGHAAANPAVTEIWVAEGTYRPTVDGTPTGAPDGPRAVSFRLLAGVALRGGFAGTESSPAERDIARHPTILDGDILGNDDATDGSKTDNAYSVVTAASLASPATLDGVIIRSGRANGPAPAGEDGGGIRAVNSDLLIVNTTITACSGVDGGAMRIAGGAVHIESSTIRENSGQLGPATGIALVGGTLTIEDTQFIDNPIGSGGLEGSAVLQTGGTLWITNATFTGNAGTVVRIEGTATATVIDSQFILNGDSALDGSVLFVDDGGSLTVQGSLFQQNLAGGGGAIGIFNGAVATITDSTFDANTATFGGGAIAISDAEPTIIGCTFTNNSAAQGGAISVIDQLGNDVSCSIIDCLFAGNSAADPGPVDAQGGALRLVGGLAGGQPLVDGCTFVDNSAEVGGGAYLQNVTASFSATSFADNAAPVGSGIALQFGGALVGNPTLTSGDEVSATDDVAPASPGAVALPAIGAISTDAFTLRNRGAGFEDRPRLRVDLAGRFPGTQHDRISADGVATLTGTLAVNLANGFVPSAGDSFRVVQAGVRSGSFDVAVFPAIPDGLALTVTHDDDGVLLSLDRLGAEVLFADPTSDPLGGTPLDAVVGDFDGDGDADLAVLLDAGAGLRSLALLLNRGLSGRTGGAWLGFDEPVAAPAPPNGSIDLAVADLNGDGRADLAVLAAGPPSVAIYLATGDPRAPMAAPALVALPATGGGLAAAARPGGVRDLYVTVPAGPPASSSVRRLVNNGAGGFTLGGLFSTVSAAGAIAAADLDQDGDDDLVIGGSPGSGSAFAGVIAIHRHDTPGSFGSATTAPVETGALALTTGDIDADGAIDVAFAGSTGVGVLRNLHDGTALLSAPVLLAVANGCVSPTLLDALDDGDLDLAFADGAGVGSLVRNDGTPGTITLTQVNAIDAPTSVRRLVSADLNADGLDDLVLLGEAGGSPSDSAGGLPSEATALLAASGNAIPGDLNGDGLVDGADLSILLGAWGTTLPEADLDGSGSVDAGDLAVLLGSWT